jgi:hypothetical protein
VPGLARCGRRPFDGGEDLGGVLEEGGAFGSERYVAGIPVQQLDAEFALQAPELLADGGLDDMQLLGGAAEVP